MNTTNLNPSDELAIDGSFGEGGGQIIRSSLALSIITNRPIHLFNIRANRKKPGLMKQHLTGLNAAAEICNAKVSGNELRSVTFKFHPQEVRAADYVFNIGTAGSTGLVLQTVLPALMFADKPSTVKVTGGTHNNKSPSFDFLSLAYAPLIEKMGPKLDFTLKRHGFYPNGGGEVHAKVTPTSDWNHFKLTDRGAIKKKSLHALVSNLPADIGKRENQTFRRKSQWNDLHEYLDLITESHGPGNAQFVELKFQKITELFTAFGERGKSASHVANELWREVKPYFESKAAIGEHLADQLMLPLAISAAKYGTTGVFTTTELSLHSTTHLDIISRFLPIESSVTELGENHNQVEIRSKS